MMNIIMAVALAAVAAVAAAMEKQERRRARRRMRMIRARAMRERRRREMKDMRWDVARYAAQVRRQERAGVTGVKHPDMAAYIAAAESRRGRGAKIEIVGRRNEA